MKILLRWLVDYAWLFYVVCAIGALIYLVRALGAQRERSLALFTLEHETATVRAVRAWAMVFVFVAIALVVFISATFIVNNIPAYDPASPRATPTPSAGVNPPTPNATSTLTDSMVMPTLESGAPTSPPPTSPPTPTEPPTAATPTSTPVVMGPLSGGMDIQFGDFGKLIGYELSSAEIATGESLVVTLYWQGLEGTSPADYTVFTHLLSESGQLIAQHDGPPANGAAPTSDWEAGATIQDTHQLTFKSEAGNYTGSATVMVGLYDPGNVSARVNTSQGQDYAILPTTVNVVPQ
jgi:hypothetical protein